MRRTTDLTRWFAQPNNDLTALEISGQESVAKEVAVVSQFPDLYDANVLTYTRTDSGLHQMPSWNG